jgi:hypothetical protein
MVTIRSLLVAGVLATGPGVCALSPASADPGAQDLLLTAEESPEGYNLEPGSVEQALGIVTTVRDWMFNGGAQLDPPSCGTELNWLMSYLRPEASAVTLWGPQILLADEVAQHGPRISDIPAHVNACKKVRVTSGAVVLDLAAERLAPPATAATTAVGVKVTVVFTLGAFQQTRVAVCFYGALNDVVVGVLAGSRDLDPAAVSQDAIIAAGSDVYSRQIAKIDKVRPRK